MNLYIFDKSVPYERSIIKAIYILVSVKKNILSLNTSRIWSGSWHCREIYNLFMANRMHMVYPVQGIHSSGVRLSMTKGFSSDMMQPLQIRTSLLRDKDFEYLL